MVETFLAYLEFEKRYSKHTLAAYQTDLEQASRFIANLGSANLTEASHSQIRTWLLSLSRDGVTASSIGRKAASLRSYFKFLLQKGLIKQSPMEKVRSPRVGKRNPVFIREAGTEKLLQSNSLGNTYPEGFEGLRDQLVIELFYGTGIRLSELIGIKVSDVNLFNQTLKVHGKRNKDRFVPLHDALRRLLANYMEQLQMQNLTETEGLLIVTDTLKPTYPVFIQRLVKRYLQPLNLDKASPHVLRHTFATHLLNNGADINAIKDLLGHASLAATQVYTHNSFEKLKEAYKLAHPKA